ncbi:transferrin [Acrasis kona]|uniref:Transferrin n=1 Tax=Acrasis kona TaxID=1008807 RepID=A0AAW2ZDM3_9EUKA
MCCCWGWRDQIVREVDDVTIQQTVQELHDNYNIDNTLPVEVPQIPNTNYYIERTTKTTIQIQTNHGKVRKPRDAPLELLTFVSASNEIRWKSNHRDDNIKRYTDIDIFVHNHDRPSLDSDRCLFELCRTFSERMQFCIRCVKLQSVDLELTLSEFADGACMTKTPQPKPSSFKMLPGLCGIGYSFESCRNKDRYLKVDGYRIIIGEVYSQEDERRSSFEIEKNYQGHVILKNVFFFQNKELKWIDEERQNCQVWINKSGEPTNNRFFKISETSILRTETSAPFHIRLFNVYNSKYICMRNGEWCVGNDVIVISIEHDLATFKSMKNPKDTNVRYRIMPGLRGFDTYSFINARSGRYISTGDNRYNMSVSDFEDDILISSEHSCAVSSWVVELVTAKERDYINRKIEAEAVKRLKEAEEEPLFLE